jgi:hypothetical protein
MGMTESGSLTKLATHYWARIHAWALHSPWLVRIARVGYAAKGVVYTLVGVLALQAAVGAVDGTLGMQGALRTLVGGWLGTLLLGVVGIGLGGYVFWRFVQALIDPEQKGAHAKGLVQRAAYVVSGLVFANLAFDALELIVDWSNNDALTTEDWTRLLLALPIGRWLVGLAGAIVIGVGVYHGYAAYTARFQHKFNWDDMSGSAKQWVLRLGRWGYTARAIIFTISGTFLILAAWQSRAQQAGGLSDALLALAEQPFGPWLLGVVALGLIAYGGYVLAEARFRHIIAS